jgi:hypothetical protein
MIKKWIIVSSCDGCPHVLLHHNSRFQGTCSAFTNGVAERRGIPNVQKIPDHCPLETMPSSVKEEH